MLCYQYLARFAGGEGNAKCNGVFEYDLEQLGMVDE
jgi:hypothetical protein